MSSQIVLSIPAMACSGCVSTIESAIKAQPGVNGVAVDLDSKTARIDTTDPADSFITAIKAAGYEATQIV